MNSLILFQRPKMVLVALQERLHRHWLLIAIPFGVVLLFAVANFAVPPKLFTQTSRMFVTPLPLDSVYEEEAARQFHWVSSEFLAIKLMQWVNGSIFAGIVHEQLLASGISEDELTVEDVVEYIEAEPSRSMVWIQVSHPDEAMMIQILDVVEHVFLTEYVPFIPELYGKEADLAVMDRTLVTTTRASLLRPLANAGIRLFVGLLGGVLLMWAAEYVEPMVYSGWEVRRLGLKNLGEIPREH